LERIIKIGKGVDAGKSPKVLVPNTDISGSLSISFQGPQGEVEKIQRNIAGFATPAIVNAQHVVDTMKALLVVNPIMMENCYEDPSRDIPTLLENENQKICDSMLTDTRNHIQKLSKSAACDIAKPSSDMSEIGFEHVMLVNKNVNQNNTNHSLSMLKVLASALIPDFEKEKDIDTNSGSNGSNTAGVNTDCTGMDDDHDDDEHKEDETAEDVPSSSMPSVPSIGLVRQSDPVCEFTNTKDIFLLSFPYLFQLGQGCNFKVRKGRLNGM
jgi:hypothetical protein